MRLVLKFKDGMTVVQDLSDEELTFSGNGNFLELMLKGKKLNGNIEVVDVDTGKTIQRKYNDLYSLEIVFAD